VGCFCLSLEADFLSMNVHFIAIGGSAMHNLAIALNKKGYQVSGSDDEIFEPSYTRLKNKGLLPSATGWYPEKIDKHLDAVILGMHARIDNPELQKAQDLHIPVFSYPEYLLEQSKNKTRIVIGGSHGKTTITSMVIHALRTHGVDCDYMVGAATDGMENTVRLSDDASYMVIEGDEYLTSPIDLRPKFHLYRPHIALISGIAWDHINVFPSFENYVDQFRIFITLIEKQGSLIYFEGDKILSELAGKANHSITTIPYGIPPHRYEEGNLKILSGEEVFSMQVFGEHNLANISGAREVCKLAGMNKQDFYRAMTTFRGASNRLQLLAAKGETMVFKDFAHSPSKVMATTQALRQRFPEKKLVACLELHTFSSLNKRFLTHYKGAMDQIDYPFVYYNPHALEMKKLPKITHEEVFTAFSHDRLKVFSASSQLFDHMKAIDPSGKVFLFMSSGNFNGTNLDALAQNLVP
jgi:UDP-N-acetylmuramate: L-alanyl-gamma-D-glutamyl-meso-diaminopimelate ligase